MFHSQNLQRSRNNGIKLSEPKKPPPHPPHHPHPPKKKNLSGKHLGVVIKVANETKATAHFDKATESVYYNLSKWVKHFSVKRFAALDNEF